MTKRQVATPGQDPNTTAQGDNATDQGTATTEGSSTALAASQGDAFQASATVDQGGDEGGEVSDLKAQVNALAEQVQALLAAGLRVSQQQSHKPVPLPSIDDKEVRASVVPVLTKDGWFVPESTKWAVSAGKGS